MITFTPSHTRKHRADSRTSGYTLVEVMISAGLAAFILAGVLTSFLFLVRSGTNIQTYSDMESQGRKALEVFAEDVRQASAIAWTSDVNITLTIGSRSVSYVYSSSAATFSRTDDAGTRALITGIAMGTFKFRAYNISGDVIELDSADKLIAAGVNTKQLQVSLEAVRTHQTTVAATNAVLSARYILRNKIVTA
jgi:type II secretory pathway pseudopilin PulG